MDCLLGTGRRKRGGFSLDTRPHERYNGVVQRSASFVVGPVPACSFCPAQHHLHNRLLIRQVCMMTRSPQRLSPLHSALERLYPHWGEVAGMPVAIDFGDPAHERAQAETLALCDASALLRATLKGPGAQAFLARQNLPVPEGIYHWRPLGGGGLIARTGAAEFFLEAGVDDEALASMEQAIRTPPSERPQPVYWVLRQDASFLLSGSRAADVLAQTCGHDFRREPGQPSKMVLTRIAGVSCSVLERPFNGIAACQLWVDGSYGRYLWETLLAIAQESGGGVAGMACFFPSLHGRNGLSWKRG